MSEPTENAPAAAPAGGVSEEAAGTPPAATARGFRFLGEDKSVHKALGGGKSRVISLLNFLLFRLFYSLALSCLIRLVICLNRNLFR